MAYSALYYTGDGVTVDYAVTFDYLDQSHIAVLVDKVRTTEIGSNYKFEWINSTTVRVRTVVDENPVPSGLEVRVVRETPISSPAVIFGGGASLSSENLNKNSEYLTYALQEATDANDAFTKMYLGSFSTAPTTDNDGETLQVGAIYFNSVDSNPYYWDGSAWNKGDLAELSETYKNAAEAARDASQAAQALAEAAQAAAETAQTAAETAETNAAASAAAALASQSASAASAAAALASETAALASQNAAAASATAAATSETNAGTSASNAATSETNASGSASAASTSETNASASAAAAATSEANAAASASAAATSASDAATSAAAAAASAASALQPGDNVSTLVNDSGYLTGITGQSIKNLSDVLSSMTPTDGQVLTYDTTNGWQAETAAAGATGGGTDQIFWENGQTVTTNYTITNGKNAMSAGPITINSGVTVTVGAGEVWTVV